jgi:type IV secretion system protein VirB11
VSELVSGEERQIALITEKLKRELGSVVLGLLDDPEVIEIILNHDGKLWAEWLGSDMREVGTMSPWQAKAMMGTVASLMETVINPEKPILECELPLDGSRFEAMLPPVVPSPVFAIRKRAIKVFSLKDYVEQGIMTHGQRALIETAVRDRSNILISGGTGSGKTTLTNAAIRHISEAYPKDRLVIIEDTRELQCESLNFTPLKVTREINMTQLLMSTMRIRPDRIIVGEVRDGAALAMLKAWNTGHPGGVATLHANSAYGALIRLEQLVAEASPDPQRELIAEAVNMVVYIERREGKRRVKEVVRVMSYEDGRYVTQSLGSEG